MKFILISAFLCMSLVANAQFAKGDKFVGGTFSFNAQSSDGNSFETTYTACSFSPSVGYFLNDKYAVGGGIGYSYSRQKAEYDPDQFQEIIGRNLLIHAFVGRYFMISNQFFFKLTGSLSYDRGSQEQDNGTTENKTKNYSLSLYARPSLLFLPSPRWGIEAGIGNLGIQHWRSLSNEFKGTSVYLDYGSFYLGFAYYFRMPRE